MHHAKPFLYLNSSDRKKKKQKICEIQSLKFTCKDSTKTRQSLSWNLEVLQTGTEGSSFDSSKFALLVLDSKD